jgi:methionyl-tRNA formyltransferase
MRIYLCGQRHFGMLVLEMLLAGGHQIVGVSAPLGDRLWNAATRRYIPLQEAGKLRADTLPDGVDLIIAAHSHDFIGAKTRARARLGAIGYHPSLLPLHRGRDAVKWTIKMRDRIAGGSVYWLNDQVDGGPIAAQDWCFVRPEWTARDLWREELQAAGVRLFQRVLADLARGLMIAIPQDETLATWEPSIDREPLFRPDLPQLGAGPDGYQIVTRRLTDMGLEPRLVEQ